jgi:hypothetical protein
MTPEEHRMLIEVRDITLENQKILKKIQLSNRASLAFKVIYWVVILGASFGAYYLIQPYIDALKGSVGAVQNDPMVATEPFTLSGAVKNIQTLKDLYK